MKLSKRNPLVNDTEVNTLVGGLGEEIKRQDLDVIEGGSWGTALAVAGLYTATQTIATQIWGCGAVLSTSAECSRTGNSC